MLADVDRQTRRTIRVPFVVNGRRVDARADTVTISTQGDADLVLPRYTEQIRDEVLLQDRHLLASLTLDEITSFLHRVGRNWRSDEYARRRLYITQLQATLGYSEQAAVAEADWISAILSSHARMSDLVAVELGSRFILDEWVRSEEAYVRAYPLGLVAHVLPGNVPSSCVLSMLRAVVTKNVSVVKTAAREPSTAVSLALSMLDVDPDHPVARSVSVVYWPESDPLGAQTLASADAVCAWGGGEAIAAARRHAAPTASFIPFGPKWSVGMVGPDADLDAAALGLAHDVSTYDQEACFSVVRVFVHESIVDAFVACLERCLVRYEQLLPPRVLSADEAVRMNTARLEGVWHDGVIRAAGERSAIVVAPPGAGADARNRTIVIHPVADLADVYDFIGPSVQTVAAAPWSLLVAHRDQLARRGVSRLVELGMTNFFRVGGAHDGTRPLQRLVRFCSNEVAAAERPKGLAVPFDQTSFLENRRFREITF